MKIVVCVKQVPATNDAKIDPETKRIIREGIKAILNPFDNYAVEEGVLLLCAKRFLSARTGRFC
jgi:electron transfer flavoprotein beta subunit